MFCGIKIVYKDKDVIVINKPVGMPSQSDLSGAADAMTVSSETLKSNAEPSALWLLHRLDRNVGGLLAFARNKKSAAAISEQIQSGALSKKYIAVCQGMASEGEYRDYLYKDSATSKSYVVKGERRGAKEAVLTLKRLSYDAESDSSLVCVRLHTGRFHQIRAQLSSRGNSLAGDKKYGSRDSKAQTPSLFAYSLSFTLNGKRIKAEALPDISQYPWSLFDAEYYKKISEEVI